MSVLLEEHRKEEGRVSSGGGRARRVDRGGVVGAGLDTQRDPLDGDTFGLLVRGRRAESGRGDLAAYGLDVADEPAACLPGLREVIGLPLVAVGVDGLDGDPGGVGPLGLDGEDGMALAR